MNPTRKKHPSQHYKYDVALSFAGEDRRYAEALFNHLTQRGFSVFYDANRQAHLWGKTPKTFENIYGPQARYVIPFVSKYYVKKDWTQYEYETAKREQQKRKGEFILPVRLDDSRLLGLHDQVIALNLARLLRSERKTKSALRKLAPFRKDFDDNVDAYQYFGTLADLYGEAGMTHEAAKAWRDAKVRANSLSNPEYASFCTSQEAKSLVKLGKAALSETAIRRALKVENNPKRRASLLIQILELLLRKKSPKAAQSTFDETLKLCKQNELHEQLVELHLLIGDHDLTDIKYEAKLNAFKAYTVAMMNSIQTNLNGMGPIASYILFKLASVDSPLTDASIKSLVCDLREHIVAQAHNAHHIVNLLLWPFVMAEQLFPLRKEPRRFLAQVQLLADPKNMERYLNNTAAEGVAEKT